MYEITRFGHNYGLAIVVCTTFKQLPSRFSNFPPVVYKVKKYYRYTNWQIGDYTPNQLHEVSKSVAGSYSSFGGQAAGFEEVPKKTFSSPDEVVHHINSMQQQKLIPRSP